MILQSQNNAFTSVFNTKKEADKRVKSKRQKKKEAGINAASWGDIYI